MCRALIQLLLNAIFLNRVASARALRPPSAWIGAVPHLVTKRLKQVLVTGGEPESGSLLCRAFASPDFGSFRELIVIVRNPQHDRLGGSLFHGFSKHAHFLTPRAPMIGVISQHAGQRWWVAIGH
jgi:hypothetical protein